MLKVPNKTNTSPKLLLDLPDEILHKNIGMVLPKGFTGFAKYNADRPQLDWSPRWAPNMTLICKTIATHAQPILGRNSALHIPEGKRQFELCDGDHDDEADFGVLQCDVFPKYMVQGVTELTISQSKVFQLRYVD
ncbi:uncharacterized protein HMPREF1541_04922 [Cyphellophora europaea CBS 101466]|uniref:Uncharacterized protein n=1 Tax=Cyphellophora europaea (strain CBS 101466) TaxID=1220924 RepID=W2RXY0_CYPE1|nr:uncharacterized protein HMPREF1541_04922 [Cyphellophora europaea CBS 101466]ETN40643.1 hypothetical protein HMPREF1541_04922 [Cyphellophora europaea CBS 101466]